MRSKKAPCSLARCFNTKPIPLRDELSLSSWQKWVRYQRFPWKMLVDAVTALVCAVLVLLIAAQSSAYTLSSNASLNHFFNPMATPGVMTSLGKVFDTSSFISAGNTFVTTYWTLPNVSLSRFGRFRDSNGGLLPPTLTLTRFKSSLYDADSGSFDVSDLSTNTTVFPLTMMDPLGPFTVGNSMVADQTILQSAKTAVFEVQFQSLNVGLLGALPYRWVVQAVFDFVPGSGSCNFKLNTFKRLYRAPTQSVDFGVQIGLSVFLLLWCLGWFFLSVRALLRGARHYFLVKRLFEELPDKVIGKYTKYYSDWESLPFSLKRKFASFWHLWNLSGCIMIISSSVMSFVLYTDDTYLDLPYNLLLGLGTFFSLINLPRYFELFRHFSVLINTLRISFRRVMAFMISVLPIFFAYVLLGVAIFSNFSERFGSMDQVAVALFCIANGDELHATFEDLRVTFPWQVVAQIYMYTFLVLFIFGVLNIIIFVVDDAFDAAKNWDRQAWKERQEFTLKNLIAILELEGKELKDKPSASAGWQLLDYDGQDGVLTEAAPLLPHQDSSDPVFGGISSLHDSMSMTNFGGEEGNKKSTSIPINSSSDIGDGDEHSEGGNGDEPPWRLSKSITQAIISERKKKRSERKARQANLANGGTDSASPPVMLSSEKGKEEESPVPMMNVTSTSNNNHSDLDSILDAALKSMQDDLKLKFDRLKAEMRGRSN